MHNEALQRLDVAVHALVESGRPQHPPEEPSIGQMFVIGDEPTGDWSGHAHALAAWTAGGWRFVEAFEGFEVTLKPSGKKMRYSDKNWRVGEVSASTVLIDGQQVVGVRQPAIADPVLGDVVDVQARTALTAVLAALRDHGLIARA